jgi:ketosteroid isomerase-like protein
MSQENVELARQYFEALNVSMDASEHLRHPDIEVFDIPSLPDADRYVGEATVRRMIESIKELGWDGQYRVQEYLEAGEEVVVMWQMRLRTPHGGGFPIETTFAHVLLFEGGKVRRVRQFLTKAEALEAAGLRE